jgi:hypothetical protein
MLWLWFVRTEINVRTGVHVSTQFCEDGFRLGLCEE